MRSPVWRVLLAPLILVLLGSQAIAWEPETRVRLVDEAIRMMPASLRLALESHRRPMLRGMLSPLEGEGTLVTAFETEFKALQVALDQGVPFTELAGRFGTMAHIVLNAGFPPFAAGSAGTGHYQHFSSFCESRRQRFPVVFYGNPATPIGQQYREYIGTVMQRAREDNQRLVRAYEAAGEPPDPAAFDDRSIPFAVGSLAYSHTFTDIVSVWLSAWKQAGGDMGLTPYLDKKNTQPQRRP
jgi:hypothetical protein